MFLLWPVGYIIKSDTNVFPSLNLIETDVGIPYG